MISAFELKRHVTDTSIFGIIIDKFRHKKKLYSVILFEIDKNSKIDFYYIILLFGLIVHL